MAGALVLTVIMAACVIGGIATVTMLRDSPAPRPVATSLPSPTITTPPPNTRTPQRCLLGEWRQTSYISTAEIFGVRVQLTGSGAHLLFRPEEAVTTYDNYVVTGTADGSRYEVIHHGTVTLNYHAEGTTLRYSNARVQGVSTWKVDGRVRESEPMQVLLDPETYHCTGNELRLYGDGYASEYRRLLPPGVPA